MPIALTPEQQLLADELLARFAEAELRELAVRLPVDKEAVDAVWPQRRGGQHGLWRSCAQWLRNPRLSVESVATYCAATAGTALSRLLTEVLKLREQEQVLVNECNSLLVLARQKQAKLLLVALEGKNHDKVRDVADA